MTAISLYPNTNIQLLIISSMLTYSVFKESDPLELSALVMNE